MSGIAAGVIVLFYVPLVIVLTSYCREKDKKKMLLNYSLISILIISLCMYSFYLIYSEISNNSQEIWISNFKKSLILFTSHFYFWGTIFIFSNNKVIDILKKMNIAIKISKKSYVIIGIVHYIIAIFFLFI